MKVRFWGVRGSIPTPGAATAEYGGNTSCVEVTSGAGATLVLDAGTGLRVFGLDYLKRKNASKTIPLLISHSHWDHIQGFPFFVPVHIPGYTIEIYGDGEIRKSLAAQMRPPVFPVDFRKLPSNIKYHTVEDSVFKVADFKITPFTLVHPQKVLGFRIEAGGKCIVYATDTEHKFDAREKNIIKAIKGADMLLYDAQYTPEEYDGGRTGWGHSTYLAGIDVAKKANVKTLVLFHHEPTHDDAAVNQILKEARKKFPNTIAAREGLILDV